MKLFPVMVMVAPDVPEVGVNEEIEGPVKEKPLKEPCPPAVVTTTSPDAPAPTTAVIVLSDTTVKELAGTPPKVTAEAPVRLVPVIVTGVPVPAEPGVKEVITGGTKYVKPGSVAVPLGVVTDTSPVAPAPTTAVMEVDERTTNEVAGTPPKLTAVAPVKLAPLIVTVVPVRALVGVKETIAG